MLNANPITELTTESAPKALFSEWLKKYFDGNDHVVGNETKKFPAAMLAFGEGPQEQPLAGNPPTKAAEIRVVILPRQEAGSEMNDNSGSGRLVTDSVLVNFWISAEAAGAKVQSEKLCEQVAELLKGILANPTTRYELSQKGIRHINPQVPQVLPSARNALRLVSASAQLQYFVRF